MLIEVDSQITEEISNYEMVLGFGNPLRRSIWRIEEIVRELGLPYERFRYDKIERNSTVVGIKYKGLEDWVKQGI